MTTKILTLKDNSGHAILLLVAVQKPPNGFKTSLLTLRSFALQPAYMTPCYTVAARQYHKLVAMSQMSSLLKSE